ncbi:PREDICTED: MADS-box transcription factor PHERES 2-like [Camelina sativa]|uniref:MADS-box transcription factor PHERES 2-like n=1 Tax=Camelina sativa TaxID=90675 RepID=A0ABM0UIQ7_CAMSA|nr:PREDICTED: MADS-box transcription factor PHERES 2-like [Camelina sativa]XP_010441730.1 PREDICTED: MADS-box transcription factor PHERES 2-like [Camelina sativa]
MKRKILLIENEASRKRSFIKRKKGMMKKLAELSTLCDVKMCAVIYSPYNADPEAWPSREGAEKVISDFMEVLVDDRNKRMLDQEGFLRKRIAKDEAKLQKLRTENQNFEIPNCLFGCLKGEIDVHKLGEKDLQNLSFFVDTYIDKITCRMQNLMENGESSSRLPPSVVVDAVAVPVGDYDHMNQNQNQQKSIQRQSDFLIELFRQIPQKIHQFNMNVNLDLNLNLNLNSNQNMILDLNQIPNVEEDIDPMGSNHHQPKTDGLASNAADVRAPNTTNK